MRRPSPLQPCRRAFPCSPPFTALRNAHPRYAVFIRFSSSSSWRDLGLDLHREFGFGAREVIGHLKAQPDRRRAAEIAGEAQRGFRGKRSLAASDLADSRGRQPERDCQRVGGEASRHQLVLQHRAGVRCGSGQRPVRAIAIVRCSFSDNPRFPRSAVCVALLRARAGRPLGLPDRPFSNRPSGFPDRPFRNRPRASRSSLFLQ